MHSKRAGPSPGAVATEATTLLAGLGILMIQVVPLALPGLLLFVIAPLGLVVLVGVVLAAPFVLPVWLGRIVLRSRARHRSPAPTTDEIRTIAAGQSAAGP